MDLKHKYSYSTSEEHYENKVCSLRKKGKLYLNILRMVFFREIIL